jgi:DNA polymerase IIIc chi subunit
VNLGNLCVMCEFGGMGMIRDLRFETKYLRDQRRAMVVISEYHNIMWVWLGMEVTMKTRKQADSVSEKFKTKGYEIDGEVLGQNINNIIIMDARTMAAGNDPEMQQNYDQLLATLDSLNYVPHGSSNHIVEIQGAAQPFVQTAQAQPQVQAQVPIATTMNLSSEALAGAFLISFLHEYNDIFVSRSSNGVIQIESSTGENFKFKVEQAEIHMLEGFVNEKIQNLYSQLSQKVG